MRLRLSSSTTVIANLIRWMSLPASAIVVLEATEGKDALDALCSSISRLFTIASTHPAHFRAIEGLALTHTDSEDITLGVWSSDTRSHGFVLDPPNFKLRLKDWVATGIEEDVQPICQRLLDAFGVLPYLKELGVEVPCIEQDTMIEWFGKCPLHTITAYGECADMVVASLSHKLSVTPQVVSYPALSTVVLHDVDSGADPMSRFLVDALRGRLEHGAPVKRLKLKDYENLYGNEVERLKVDLGPSIEIDWDRVETDGIYSDGGFDSEDSDDSSNAWLVGWWIT